MKNLFKIAMMSTALLSVGAVQAAENVVWWDFLSGGDGVRMKALIEQFNTEHAGEITIEPTTLEWGTPFYTKVQTSAAIGEGPDVMTYHLSRVPLGVQSGALAPIATEDHVSQLTRGDVRRELIDGRGRIGGRESTHRHDRLTRGQLVAGRVGGPDRRGGPSFPVGTGVLEDARYLRRRAG